MATFRSSPQPHRTWSSVSLLLACFLPFGHQSPTQETTTAQPTADGLDALRSTNHVPETPHTRRVYFLGGQYVGPAGQTRKTGQVYTEELLPVGGARKPNPIIFFHQGFQTGASWLQTPDNRQGWASYYLDQGYAVYLVDTASSGRSNRLADEPVNQANSVENCENSFTAPEKASPLLWPQAALHSQWPGTGLRNDPIFDAFYASAVSSPSNNSQTEAAVTKAICDDLLTRTSSSFLINQASGGFFPYAIADKCPDKVQGIVGIDTDPSAFLSLQNSPSHPWGLTDIPITYDPPVADPATDLVQVTVGNSTPAYSSCRIQASVPTPKRLVNIAKIPILSIVSEAGYHATVAHCQPLFLRQAGVPVSLVYLADVGIRGNGQFMQLEKNNREIAMYIQKWLESREGKKGKGDLSDISSKQGTNDYIDEKLGIRGNATKVADNALTNRSLSVNN